MGSQEVKEESVSTTVASGTRLRKGLTPLSEMSDQGRASGQQSILLYTKEGPCVMAEIARALVTGRPEL